MTFRLLFGFLKTHVSTIFQTTTLVRHSGVTVRSCGINFVTLLSESTPYDVLNRKIVVNRRNTSHKSRADSFVPWIKDCKLYVSKVNGPRMFDGDYTIQLYINDDSVYMRVFEVLSTAKNK